MEKIKAGIIGATGYAGAELVRLLSGHPNAEVAGISSVSYSGKELQELYPSYAGNALPILEEDGTKFAETCDVIFASLPHGLSEEAADACIKQGKVFIDLGADFRLEKEAEYEKWYGKSFDIPELHKQAVYGLVEWYRQDIRKAKLIGNPGCYPTSIELALFPALKNGLVSAEGIVIDSKSGVTGAGKGLSQKTHFPECNEALGAYKAGAHRHTPEIEQMLGKAAGHDVKVTFLPHLIPANRGILSSIYCDCKADMKEIRQVYLEAYENEPFVHVLEEGQYANIHRVRYSNCCHISLHQDQHTGKLIICSAIDNMIKGAAGQAIQNMNLIFGLGETTGLPTMAPAF